MAKTQAVWGIDVGQCALKAIKLSYDPKEDKVVAEGFDYEEHPKILSQPDADPDELIRSALEKFLSRNTVNDDLVYVSIPGQSGLARFVRLPPVDVKRIPEIVKFEAKQQIPFPLEDVIWDYQRLLTDEEDDGDDEGPIMPEVGIFAIKRDVVNTQLAPYQRLGMEIEAVQLAPMSLYNYAAYDLFFELRRKAAAKAAAESAEGGSSVPAINNEEEEEVVGETIIVLDIGADKTDMVVTDGDAIWLRNLPIGGNHFTRALTKEMKLTFAKAEHLKRNAMKAQDPKALFKAMRPVFQDFLTELQRSITYFSNTHRDKTIRKVYGVGNGFKLEGLGSFLQKNLPYSFEQVTKFDGLAPSESLAAGPFQENLPSFCVAYGLALQGIGQTPIQTNLLPPEIRVGRIIRAKKPWSLVAAASVLLGFVAVFGGNFRVYKAVHAEAFDSSAKAADSAVSNFSSMASSYTAAVGKFETTKQGGESLVGLDVPAGRTGWMEVFALVNRALPPRSADPNDKQIERSPEINVEHLDAAFLTDLSAWHASHPEAAKATMMEPDKSTAPSGEGWVFQILGYTFNEGNETYLRDSIMKNLQTEAMRKEGITHIVLSKAIVDWEWTPRKGDPIRTWPRMAAVAQQLSPQAANNATSSESMSSSGTMSQEEMYRMQQEMASNQMSSLRNQMMMPGDFMEYNNMALNMAQNVVDDTALVRTDFAIQFVWTPPKPEEKTDEAAPAPSP